MVIFESVSSDFKSPSSAMASNNKLSTTIFFEEAMSSENNFLGKKVLNAKNDSVETTTTAND